MHLNFRICSIWITMHTFSSSMLKMRTSSCCAASNRVFLRVAVCLSCFWFSSTEEGRPCNSNRLSRTDLFLWEASFLACIIEVIVKNGLIQFKLLSPLNRGKLLCLWPQVVALIISLLWYFRPWNLRWGPSLQVCQWGFNMGKLKCFQIYSIGSR